MKIRTFVVLFFMLIYWQSSLWSQAGNKEIVVTPGSTVTLTANTTSGVSYQWFHDSFMIPGAQTMQYLANLPGVYTVVTFNAQDCPSPMSPEVKIIFSDTAPPFYDTLQIFCDYPVSTVANLAVSGQNIKWYNASGTALPADTPLQNQAIYYATQTIDGTESVSGPLVSVQIRSVLPPTTNYTTQHFCSDSHPAVSDIQINESGVKWYDQATGGNSIPDTTLLTDGTVYYASKTDIEEGISCESGIRLAILVLVNNAVTPIMVSGKSTVCINEEAVYTTVSGMQDYSWLVEGGTIVEGGQPSNAFVKVLWGNKGQGSVSVSYTDDMTCNKDDVGILDIKIGTCSDLSVDIKVNSSKPFIDDIITFTITVQNQGGDIFRSIVVRENIPKGFAFVSSIASHGIYNAISKLWNIPVLNEHEKATLVIKVKVLKYDDPDFLNTVDIESSIPIDSNLINNHAEVQVIPECILVYNGFSPDRDGINDFFRIDCIEKYPDNTLEIYNRYGRLVYSMKGYQNDWEGIANVTRIIDRGTILPNGTYFYILNLGDGSKTRVGWVYILR